MAYGQGVLASCKIPAFDRDTERRISRISRGIWRRRDGSTRAELDALVDRAFESGSFRPVGIDRFFS